MSTRKRGVFISFQHDDLDQARGFQLLAHNPKVTFDFNGRHLITQVASKDEEYVGRSIREKLKGTSVTVVLCGKKTSESDWVRKEIEWSGAKTPPNELVAIKLQSDAAVPPGLAAAGAEVLDWTKPEDTREFGAAIERAASRREQRVRAQDFSGGSVGKGCGR